MVPRGNTGVGNGPQVLTLGEHKTTPVARSSRKTPVVIGSILIGSEKDSVVLEGHDVLSLKQSSTVRKAAITKVFPTSSEGHGGEASCATVWHTLEIVKDYVPVSKGDVHPFPFRQSEELTKFCVHKVVVISTQGKFSPLDTPFTETR
jgi:hypothetical protein